MFFNSLYNGISSGESKLFNIISILVYMKTEVYMHFFFLKRFYYFLLVGERSFIFNGSKIIRLLNFPPIQKERKHYIKNSIKFGL
jgi:hypothetical protein